MLAVPDHLLAAVLVFGIPLYAALYAWPRMKQRMATAEPGVRIATYLWNIGLQWLLTAGALVVWITAGRPVAGLGLGVEGVWAGWRFWTSCGVVAVIAGMLTAQYVLALRSVTHRRTLRRQLEQTAPFAPRSGREMRTFAALSLTAGVCEEILYRGFLIWYVATFTGADSKTGIGTAIVLAAAVFATGHLYQGAAGAGKVFVLGLVAGALYVLAGSLWLVMFLHAYIDLAGGLVAVALYRDDVVTDAELDGEEN